MQQSVIDERYTLIELLGSGGMAQVYLAHDEVLDRDVALKILREQYAEDEEFVERFRQEARSAAGLAHPNIVSVYDQGRSEDGAYYMAMEYVPRGTLKDRIQRDGALAPDAAVGVALQIADALSAAHERGVIHRDIKPQNVLVTRTGDVKVADFGIARAASGTRVTRTGHVLGTAGYMSPEQAKGEAVGPRSDLYSLGVVLYEMLTGNLPYEADSALAQAVKHIHEPPPSPREANPEVPEALDALALKLLAKNPEDRYPSAAALASDLERVRAGSPLTVAKPQRTEAMTAPLPPNPEERTRRAAVHPPVAVPPRPPEGGGKRRRGKLFSTLATLLFAAAVLGGLAWALRSFDVAEPGGSEGGAGAKQAEAPAVKAPSTVLVPDLYYASTAATDLANAGLYLGNWNEVPNGTVPAGIVVETYPLEGTEVEPGTAVNIFVSTGPQQAPAQAVGDLQRAPTVQPLYENGDNENNDNEEPKKKGEKKGKGKGKN